MALAKRTAGALILLVLGGATAAIVGIVHAHRPEGLTPVAWHALAELGDCMRRGERGMRQVANVATAREVDEAHVDLGAETCAKPIGDLAVELADKQQGYSGEVLVKYAKAALDFSIAASDLKAYLARGKQRVDRGKGNQLAQKLEAKRQALMVADAELAHARDQIYDGALALAGLTARQQQDARLAIELEHLADLAAAPDVDRVALGERAKELRDHHRAIATDLDAIAPWLRPLGDSGVAPDAAAIDETPIRMWQLVHPTAGAGTTPAR